MKVMCSSRVRRSLRSTGSGTGRTAPSCGSPLRGKPASGRSTSFPDGTVPGSGLSVSADSTCSLLPATGMSSPTSQSSTSTPSRRRTPPCAKNSSPPRQACSTRPSWKWSLSMLLTTGPTPHLPQRSR